MGSLITRGFKDTSLLSAAGRQRAKEYLISVGYREEQLQPIVWPEDAVSAYRDHMGQPWKFTTKADILRGKRERMEQNLRRKREYGIIHRRPLYVWVFWCPGVGIFFRGWWIALIGRGYERCRYLERDKIKISSLMKLFPLVEPTLYGPPDIREWKREFVKRYQRGTWCGKPQGKAPIWAEVQGSSIERILGRAEWPNKTA
ncbi:hypothetical protein LCGC14_0390750 [marine sediment metagenome]|uniref:Uncharacterized protein n=1 Tax=marine sediment metagenome TaxID=412755 RepID=A0A0F9SZW2_9ZZZZ